jgi:hypothetical protein
MNTLEIEERVRAATRAAADTVAPDSVPPLRLATSRSFRARLRPSAWARWLAPMAAAAAVVAVAVAMVTVGRSVNSRPAGTASSPSSRPGPVRSGPPISSYVASGRVPRYYISIEAPQGNPNFHPAYAVVRATATGAALETVLPPDGQTVMAVTAAADDRTFMLDTQPWDNPNSSNYNQNFEPRTFRLLRLDQSGRVVSLSRMAVSVPRGQLMTGFALSPDGSKLAIAVNPNNKREPGLTVVKVITLATGATATWTAYGTIGTEPDDARSLSWADDERTLAFTWAAAGPGIHTGLRLLDLTTGGGSLLADSREAVSLINQDSLPAMASLPPDGNASPSLSVSPSLSAGAALPMRSPVQQAVTPKCQLDAIITPDGSAIVCGATGTLPHQGAETEFIEYSTATGKVARVLGHWTFGTGGLAVDVLWSNASGSVLIGMIPGGDTGQVGVISGNEFTPVPISAAWVNGAW